VWAATSSGARWAGSPSWIEELPVDLDAPIDANLARNGAYTLLRDVRFRLGAHSVERYYRSVKKAVSQAGVEELGEIQIEYSPHYEQLLLHRAALIRDGQVLDQTRRALLRVLDSEDEQDRRVYSGRVTALLVLSDVREGDVIDVAFSLKGNNPVLGDRFAGHIRLGAETNVRRVHAEVKSAVSRAPLHWSVRGQAAPPTEKNADGQRVLTWDLNDEPGPPREDRVPNTFKRPAELELSEFADWSEVARWASELYPATKAPALEVKARELKAGNPDIESAALAALRFVQDEVRYLSISLGPNSVTPHAPASVLAQRFGDCKDKSYLLVELLRALGVRAYPALADSELRAHLRESLPSPFAFDHVVTAIDLGDKRYYVDPTWSHQGGSLASIAQANVGAVLVIAPDSTEAVAIPPAPEPREPPRDVRSEFKIGSNGEATLMVTTTFSGEEADDMRSGIAAKSAKDMSRSYLNFYAQAFPDLSAAAPLDIKDDRSKNVITIRESYKIPKFWRDGERRLTPDVIWNYLEAPEVTQREAPLALDHPVWVRERLLVSLPFAASGSSEDERYGDAAASVHQVVEFKGPEVVATQEYRSLADEVPIEALSRHLQFLSDARKNAGVELSEGESEQDAPAEAGKSREAGTVRRRRPMSLLLAPMGLGLLALVAFAARGARRRSGGVKSNVSEPNAAPESAASLEAARALFTRAPCACGASIAEDSVQFTKVRLGGQLLHAARADCGDCSQRRHAYFCLPEDVREA
jgi:hypothetical protein